MRRHGIRPILIGVPLVLAAWIVSMAALTLAYSAGLPVVVIARGGAAGALDAVVAAAGNILQIRDDTVIAIADDPGFVARLYRHGALMVVQAPAGGCMFSPIRQASTLPKPSPAI